MKFLLLVTGLILPAPRISAGNKAEIVHPILREDFQRRYSQSICEHLDKDVSSYISSINIYDTQTEFQKYTPKKAVKNLINLVKKATIQMAEKNFHHSYSYGICGNTGWGISFPAPTPIHTIEKTINLSDQNFEAFCKKVLLQKVNLDFGKSETLHLEKSITLPSNFTGIVSLTCFPHHPKWLGPVLWYSIKFADQNFNDTKMFTLETNEKNEIQLLNWINKRRSENKLSTIEFLNNTEINILNQYSSDHSILHNKIKIQKLKNEFKNLNYQFLGENKALAPSISGLARLMWYSPSHRDLLLNEDAHYFYIAIDRVEHNQFATIYAFKKIKGDSRIP